MLFVGVWVGGFGLGGVVLYLRSLTMKIESPYVEPCLDLLDLPFFICLACLDLLALTFLT